MQDFIFVSLAAQQTGAKPFDGMAVGTFYDMRGVKCVFKAEELPEYVKNTKAAILSTTDADGNPVGLPIDPRGHYHDEDAAGWIIDAELAETGDKIRLFPRWTRLGEELIGSDLQRFFSPTIDPTNRVIMGGSLTNWPATRTPKSEILLKPVELQMSEPTLQLTDGSLDEQVNRCKQAFYDLYWSIDAFPVEVFEDHLIAYLEDNLWRVAYTVDAEGAYSFAPQGEWVKVKLSYVEAALNWVKRLFRGKAAQAEPIVSTPQAPQMATAGDVVQGASNMPEPGNPVSPAHAELTAEQNARIEALVEERSQLRVAGLLAQKERENRTAEFSARMVSKGLPVGANDLTAFLASLTAEQQDAAEKILSRVAETGLVPLGELGHSQTVNGNKPLPAGVETSLRSWISAGQTIAEFFRVNAIELGNQADYNLAEFTEVNNG